MRVGITRKNGTLYNQDTSRMPATTNVLKLNDHSLFLYCRTKGDIPKTATANTTKATA